MSLIFWRLVAKKHRKLDPEWKMRFCRQKSRKSGLRNRFLLPKWRPINVGDPENHQQMRKNVIFGRSVFWANFEMRKTTILSIFGLKRERWAAWAGSHGREPEGGFHPPWRVIIMSRSETEWNDTTFVCTTPEPGLETPRRISTPTAHAAHPWWFGI